MGLAEPDSHIKSYKAQLGTSDKTDEINGTAYLWALARLSQQLEQSVTANEVENEINQKIEDLIERVEITDAALRKEVISIREDCAKTREIITKRIEQTKTKVLEDLDSFKGELEGALYEMLFSSKEVQENWVVSTKGRVQDHFDSVKDFKLRRIVTLFIVYQLILVLGIVFYERLRNALTHLL